VTLVVAALDSWMSAVENNAAALVEGQRANTGVIQGGPARRMRLHHEYKHSDGVYHRVPHSWSFPKLSIENMYTYWHCGDDVKNIPAMKYSCPSDVKHLGKLSARTLREIKKSLA
jgi:hypothetical protein